MVRVIARFPKVRDDVEHEAEVRLCVFVELGELLVELVEQA